MKLGFSDRLSNEFATWERRRQEMMQRFQVTRAERQQEMHTTLERKIEDAKVRLREGEAMITEVIKTFS
jgi:hypothetical protein